VKVESAVRDWLISGRYSIRYLFPLKLTQQVQSNSRKSIAHVASNCDYVETLLLYNLHNAHFINSARVQYTRNVGMQTMGICRLRLDGDPLAVDKLDVRILLRAGGEPELSDISAHLVQLVDGKDQVEIISQFTGLGELDANISTAGSDSTKWQRMPNDWPAG